MNNDSSWGGYRGGHWYCYLLFTAAEQRLTLQIIYATKHSGKTPHSNKNYECSRGINCCAWCTPGYCWPFGCQGKLLANIQLAINQNSHVLPVGLLSSLSSPNLYVQAGFPQPLVRNPALAFVKPHIAGDCPALWAVQIWPLIAPSTSVSSTHLSARSMGAAPLHLPFKALSL